MQDFLKEAEFFKKAIKIPNLFKSEKFHKYLAGVGTSMGAALGTIGTLKMVEMMSEYFRKKRVQAKSKEYYIKMLEKNPQLQKHNPEDIAKYWESLNHFAPSMAEDPLAAGAYITQSLNRLSTEEFGGPPPEVINTLADTENKIRGKGSSSMSQDVTRKVLTDYFSKKYEYLDDTLKQPEQYTLFN